MSPLSSKNNAAYLHLANAEPISNHVLRDASRAKRPDLFNLIFCQLAAAVLNAARRGTSALGRAVSVVFGYGSSEQMIRPEAERVVTRVANQKSLRYRALGNHEGQPVCLLLLPLMADGPVSIAEPASGPLHAGIARRDGCEHIVEQLKTVNLVPHRRALHWRTVLALSAFARCGALLIVASAAYSQTYPNGIYVPLVAKNNVQTTLAASMTAGDTTAVVASTTGWAANMYAYVCDTTTVTAGVARCSGTFEIMKVTAVPSSVLLTVTRAQDGTSAIAHASGKGLLNAPVSVYTTSAQIELAAIEAALGTNLSNIPTSPIVGSSTYNFAAQSPTSPASLTAGSRTITMPGGCPLGMNGTNSRYYVAILGGGNNEAGLVTGGTCTSGAASGNITVTIAKTHSAGYTIASAAAGIPEAIQVMYAAGTGGRVYVPKGILPIYGPIIPPYQYTYWIEGTGRSSTVLSVATTFCNPSALACTLATNGVVDFSDQQVTAVAADSGGIKGLTISFTQPDSTNVALYTAWPPAVYIVGGNHTTVEDVIIERAWDAITSPASTNGVTIKNVGMSFFHRGISIDVCVDILDISHTEAWVFGLSSDQSSAFRAVGTNNYALDLQQVDYGQISNFTSDAGKFATLHKNGSGGVPIIVGTNIDMDSTGGWEQSNGYARLSNVSTSTIIGTAPFSVSGGTLVIDGVSVFNSGSLTAMFTYAPSQTNAGAAAGLLPGLFISNLYTSASTEDQYIVYATTSGAFAGTGTVQVRGGAISRSPGISYTKQLFVEAAGTGSIVYDLSNIKVGTNGGTAASAISFASSNAHAVSFVDAPGGWTYTVPSTTRWWNNSGFTSNFNAVPTATKFAARTSAASLVALISENYIASETGANNAIAGALTDAAGVAVPVADGLCITIKLAHTMQAGANTMDLNATGAVSVKRATNAATDLGTAFAATGRPTMCYNSTGPVWQVVSQ